MTSTDIALYQGSERSDIVRQALLQVIDGIDWPTRQHVVVKPNLVQTSRPAAITHRDTLAVVLEAIRSRYNGRLTIAEGCALEDTADAFAGQGYPELAAFYGCDLLDLNADEPHAVTVYDRAGEAMHLRLAQTIVKSDCRISLSVPKTHDAVLVTLSIKNMIMGSLMDRRRTARGLRTVWQNRLGQILHGHGNGWGSDKIAMHQSYPIMNVNLAVVAPLVWPHLVLLDGFVAMEGAGPIDGEPVPWGVAFAGRDALAVDALAARLMGFAVDEVGYLHYCAQLGLGSVDFEQLRILGNVEPEAVQRTFKPHPHHGAQRQWIHAEAGQLLAAPSLP